MVFLCVLAGIIAFLIMYVIWLLFRIVFYSPNCQDEDVFVVPPGKQYEEIADIMLEKIYNFNQIPFEQIYIRSYDGIILSSRYYHNKDNAPIFIFFHGYRGNAVRDYSDFYDFAVSMGFNSLVVDQRARGKSGGHVITFGIKERYDCQLWCEYAAERFGNAPVYLWGISMGAATVLMASDLPLPHSVKGVIADCPYSSPKSIITKVCNNLKLPGRFIYPFVWLGALIIGNFRLGASSALKSVQRTQLPILLIHGDDDRFVPCDMSYEIFKSAKENARIVTIPMAGHGISHFVDSDKYENAVISFINDLQKKKPDSK